MLLILFLFLLSLLLLWSCVQLTYVIIVVFWSTEHTLLLLWIVCIPSLCYCCRYCKVGGICIIIIIIIITTVKLCKYLTYIIIIIIINIIIYTFIIFFVWLTGLFASLQGNYYNCSPSACKQKELDNRRNKFREIWYWEMCTPSNFISVLTDAWHAFL